MTRAQRNAFLAAFLGWTLDAFDFFLVPLLVVRIARDFRISVPELLAAVTATLLFRPLGALLFGMLGDHYGRRGPLMIDVAAFAFFEAATAFAPNFHVFLVLRALFGIAMGGEWGLGAALALESLPVESRGFFSGLLQQGYACGYLLATLAVWLLLDHLQWRGMFLVGALPALLVIFLRSRVAETAPQHPDGRERGLALWRAFRRHRLLFLYAVVLMTGFNYLSHGTQDLYPTFLEQQRGASRGVLTGINVVANLGAIAGGALFGTLSQKLGRRRAVIGACVLGMCAVPLWAHAPTLPLLALGGFLVQFCVQGAWGVVPAHLNELAPAGVRASFPGLAYQLGNFLAAGAAMQESLIAKQYFPLPGGGSDYARALTGGALGVFTVLALLTAGGTLIAPERRESAFTKDITEST